MLKYSIISFWEGFNYENNFITQNYTKNHIFTNNYNEADFLIIGSFVNENEYNLIKTLECKKILFITEPIQFCYSLTYQLYLKNQCEYIVGCIHQDIPNKKIKFPLYILYNNENDPFDSVNHYVKQCDSKEKKFGCLICRHDSGKTRRNIYHSLKTIAHIDCPSHLFNNCSNEELNTIGNVEYIKQYKFNICPENFLTDVKGYITEKLFNCCCAGTIPIYCGWFDEYDEKIFNKNRILFFDPNNPESIENTKKKITFLLENETEFIQFYQQDVFNKEAFETFTFFKNNLTNVCNSF